MMKSPWLVIGAATLALACGTDEAGEPVGTGGSATGGAGGGIGGSMPGGGGSGGQLPPTGGVSGGGAGGQATGGTPATGPCVPGTVYESPNLAAAASLVYTAPGTVGLLEGPVWVAQQGALYFSDMSAGIQKLVPPATVTPFLPIAGGTNGLAVNSSGLIVACTYDPDLKRVSLVDPASAGQAPFVSDYQGQTFNSPNDVAIRSDGTVYFTDPNWQGTGTTGMQGVYRVPPGGVATLVDGALNRPNGIALSPDGSVLFVGDWNSGGSTGRIGYYLVAADGSVGARAGDLATGLQSPDGMTVDCAGNLYATEHSTGRIHVFGPNLAPIGHITVATSLTNLAFGGADGRTLYATAGRGVYAITMNVPGMPY